MELQLILDRFGEGLEAVDQSTSVVGTNQRTGAEYLPGVPSLTERQLCDELVQWWRSAYPFDFEPAGLCHREVPYPNVPRARCDIVFSSPGHVGSRPEWAIEVKRIQFVGDNGKNNDFNVQKMLSPYLKDRSLIHDIHRMRSHPIAKRHAVIGYAFSYSLETCREARRLHPEETDRVKAIEKVCRTNDPEKGIIDSQDLLNFADFQFKGLGVVLESFRKPFAGLWRHPCGGHGFTFAWEVAAPEAKQEPHQGSLELPELH